MPARRSRRGSSTATSMMHGPASGNQAAATRGSFWPMGGCRHTWWREGEPGNPGDQQSKAESPGAGSKARCSLGTLREAATASKHKYNSC